MIDLSWVKLQRHSSFASASKHTGLAWPSALLPESIYWRGYRPPIFSAPEVYIKANRAKKNKIDICLTDSSDRVC